MYAYFDRDNVALKGLANMYSDEDQYKRGGKVKLQSMRMPVSEFGHIANENNDVQLVDFVESNYLTEQILTKIEELNSGVRHFDQMLLNGNAA
ncbi:unnamed protein product [Malus baccata var. baccata]